VAQQAATLEAFFSGTSRQHHAEEEAKVFPPLLAGTDPVLVAAVRTLKQDHGWIEQNWSEISPQLLAIARGYQGTDPAELAHAIEVFHELCADHIALEESLVYPEAKALHAKALARRAARLTATP
jgi:hemerythrin-like domain-containing protein